MLEINAENRNALIEKLRDESSEPLIIGIDGICGSGKTTLSRYIITKLNIETVHLDDLLVEKRDTFVEALNYDYLQKKIAHRKKALIIEGCCLLDVLIKVNISSDILIYCKEISRDTNIWHYGTNFDEYVRSSQDNHKPGLEKELLEYHKRMRPWERADVIHLLFNDLKR